MRAGCIDIGSNTTRLLVADRTADCLQEVHQERAFTRIGRGMAQGGEIAPEKIEEVVAVVGAQLLIARDLGATRVRGVATAAIRHADFCLIPARPSVADIEATASTLQTVRAWKKPFAFVLNQTPIRGQRIGNAATSLGDKAALDLSDVLAQPLIVMRNDHQDALSAGLAVSEFAPSGKSADEIRGLWQWLEARLYGAIAKELPIAGEFLVSPNVAPSIFLEGPSDTVALASWSGL